MSRNFGTSMGLTAGTLALALFGALPAATAMAESRTATAVAVAGDATAASHPKHKGKRGKVIARNLNIRKGANTQSMVVGHLHKGEIVKIKCKTFFEPVQGNNVWYFLPKFNGWVSARWVKNLTPIPQCLD